MLDGRRASAVAALRWKNVPWVVIAMYAEAPAADPLRRKILA